MQEDLEMERLLEGIDDRITRLRSARAWGLWPARYGVSG